MNNRPTSRSGIPRIESKTLRSEYAETARLLIDRSARMDRDKQALLRMIVDQGATFDQVARLSGEHASTVSRRFRSILRHLRGRPSTATGSNHRHLNTLEKTILIESFLYGTPQTRIAARLGISRYRVRKILLSFQGNRKRRTHV